jgi:hypothetical protein
VHRAMRLSFNHLTHLMLPKTSLYFIKNKFSRFLCLWGYFIFCFWYFTSSSNQIHILLWKWIPMSMTTLLVRINTLVPKFAYSQCAVWCWENWMSTEVTTMNVQSNGLTFIPQVFCRVQWALNSSP